MTGAISAFAFLIMIAGLLFTAQISIGVSITIFGAALWIGAAVHMVGEDILKYFRKKFDS